MRPLYLSAPPVGIALVPLAIPPLVALTALGWLFGRARGTLGGREEKKTIKEEKE